MNKIHVSRKEDILFQYDSNRGEFEALGQHLEKEIARLIGSEIKTLMIYFRVKDRESLGKKIDKRVSKAEPGKPPYQNLNEITDILGLRIITYHDSDVVTISRILKSNFQVDVENSPNKRKRDTKEFGYSSLHLVVSLKEGNIQQEKSLREISGLKVEIQVRTILQHAWAEIEHSLGYKYEGNVPGKYQRSFSRLSAMLEIGDIEFDRLRRGLTAYKGALDKSIEKGGRAVHLNQDSLSLFLQKNSQLKKLKDVMTDKFNVRYVESFWTPELIDRFGMLGIRTIYSLEQALKKNKDHLSRFIVLMMEKRQMSGRSIPDNSPLYYLAHFLASGKGDGFFREYRRFGNEKGYRIASQLNFPQIFQQTEQL